MKIVTQKVLYLFFEKDVPEDIQDIICSIPYSLFYVINEFVINIEELKEEVKYLIEEMEDDTEEDKVKTAHLISVLNGFILNLSEKNCDLIICKLR